MAEYFGSLTVRNVEQEQRVSPLCVWVALLLVAGL